MTEKPPLRPDAYSATSDGGSDVSQPGQVCSGCGIALCEDGRCACKARVPSPGDLLRHVAAAREEYAKGASDEQRDWLLFEANAFRNAARIVDDPSDRPWGLLPTWWEWPPPVTPSRTDNRSRAASMETSAPKEAS